MTEQIAAPDDFAIAGSIWIGSNGRPRSVIVADDHYAIAVDCDDAGFGQPDRGAIGPPSKRAETASPVRPEAEDVLIAYSPSVVLDRSHSD